MKKVFVILLTICLIVLSGCKPALPGATIYISNETGLTPESYELDILFDDSRAANPRAFHMKNIGSEIATSQKSIVLENMPPTMYVAEVKAYDGIGQIVGTGTAPFKASDTTSVTVHVSEMPSAVCRKTFRFPSNTVDNIILNIRNNSGNIIRTEKYSDGFDNTEMKVITTDSIRLDSYASSFEWLLKKGSNTVAVFNDTLESPLKRGEVRELGEDTIMMGFKEISDQTYESRQFGKISIKVVPDDKLRSTIYGFNFKLDGNESVQRSLRADNTYTINIPGSITEKLDVTVIPVMKDEVTELTNFATSVSITPNVKLQSIEFKGIDASKVQNMELGYTTLEFDIVKIPENYTRFGEGEITVEGNGVLDYTVDGNHVTVNTEKPGDATLTYKEPVHEVEDSVEFNIGLHKPELHIDTSGSAIRLTWDYIHPDCRVILHSEITDLKPMERNISEQDVYGTFETDITDSLRNNYYETSIYKSSRASYYIEVRHDNLDKPVISNTVKHETGEDNLISIVLPEMKDMDIVFTPSVNYEEILTMQDKVTFSINTMLNKDITEVFWIVNGKLVQEKSFTEADNRDTFVFSAEDLNIDIHYGNGVVPQDVVIAVQATDGSIYSKNITLKINMESRT